MAGKWEKKKEKKEKKEKNQTIFVKKTKIK